MLRHINFVWFSVVAIVFIVLLLNPDWLSRESVSGFLNDLGPLALLCYLVLSLSRALLLIPSTPFILAGAVAFPDSPLLVLTISLLGIAAGAYLIYSFPSFGGFDAFLEQKYPEKISQLKQKMGHKYALLFVVGWSFFPLVPTDVICYVAGLAKMRFRNLLAAMLVGELPLVTIYVFAGMELGEWLRVV